LAVKVNDMSMMWKVNMMTEISK